MRMRDMPSISARSAGAEPAAGGAGGRTAHMHKARSSYFGRLHVTFPLLAYCIITNAYTLLRKMSETSVKMKKDVGMTPCQKLLKQEGTATWIESIQQSSATPSLHIWGLRKIVGCSQSTSQCLLVSTVFGTVSSLHPSSFLHSVIHMCSTL